MNETERSGVVLANRSALSGRVSPSRVVAGLTLTARGLLQMQALGIERLFVLIDEDADDHALEAARVDARHTRLKTPAKVIRAWPELGEATLWLRYDVHVARAVYDGLEAGGASFPMWGSSAIARSRLSGPVPSASVPSASVLSASVLSASILPTAKDSWRVWVEDEVSARRLFKLLFEACRKSVDGLVSRHLNRHVSLFVSRRIVNLPITPNQVSAITFLFALAAAWFVVQGTYVSLLVGAILFQLNSILDGVDGELARVRHQGSVLGQWVDTVCDDTSNILFYGALSYAAFQMPAPGPLFAKMGVASVIMATLTMGLYYSKLMRIGSGDFYALGVGGESQGTGVIASVVTLIGLLAKKDFFIFAFVIAAAFGVLPYALPVIAAGTLITFLTGVGLHLRSSPDQVQAE